MKDDFDITPLKKKKRVNSRKKGNRFENKVAKILNERFETDEFCRSPGSGAFATTHKLPKYLKVYGDLITPESFIYIIECKKGYNDLQLSDLLNSKSILRSMIAQASRDSEKSSRKFILVIGQDRRDPMAITNDVDLPVKGCHLKGNIGSQDILVTKLEELLRLDNIHFLS